MKSMKKKGFTLVELLVVIAIVAILATVSVVGYTVFLTQANQSNAVTELSQIKDVVCAAVLDGEEVVKVDDTLTVTFTYANDELTAKVGEEAAKEEEIEKAMLALTEITLDNGQVFEADVDEDGKITSVAYTYANNATATWTIKTGKVQ